MKIIIIVWLILAVLTSLLVVAALMRSSQLSQQEGVSESYEDWEERNQAQEIYQPQTEQQ